MFSEIRFALIYGKTGVNIISGCITVGRELFESEILETELAKQVIRICSISAKKISIWGRTGFTNLRTEAEEEQIIQQFAFLVIEHCENVKELEFMARQHDMMW